MKVLFIFLFILTIYKLNPTNLKPEIQISIQEKILECVIETSKKQLLIETKQRKKFRLRRIINRINEVASSRDSFFYMNLMAINQKDSIYKVKLNLSILKEFISDTNIIRIQERFGDTLAYDSTFQKYYKYILSDVNYSSKFLNLSNTSPIVFYIRILDEAPSLLKKSDIIKKYPEERNNLNLNEFCN